MYWLETLQAISDPYCQAVSVAVFVCLAACRLVLFGGQLPMVTEPYESPDVTYEINRILIT